MTRAPGAPGSPAYIQGDNEMSEEKKPRKRCGLCEREVPVDELSPVGWCKHCVDSINIARRTTDAGQ